MSAPLTVVTGAAGFLGSHLLACLAERGLPCLGVDREAPAVPVPGTEYVIADCTDETALAGLAPRAPAAAVIHLAACIDSAAPEAELARVNVQGTRLVMQAAARWGARRFVYLSTVAVYPPSAMPLTVTEESPTGPADAYGASKLAAESAVREYPEWTIIRPTNIVGEGNDRYLPMLRKWARRRPLYDLPVSPHLVYAGDVAAVLADCITAAAARNRVFIAADAEQRHTFGQVTRMIWEAAHGREWRWPQMPAAVAGPTHALLTGTRGDGRRFSDAACRAVFGPPRYGLRAGLQRYWQWAQQTMRPCEPS